MRYYMKGHSTHVTVFHNEQCYVVRNDGVTTLSLRPVQPGQAEFIVKPREKIYNSHLA